MLSGAEVVALLTAILTPILGGFSGLFYALVKAYSGRLDDAQKAQDRLAGVFEERLADRDREVDELRADRDYFRDMAYRGMTAADRATGTAERAIEVARVQSNARRDDRR